ncbi:hypothetical protein BD410DRAFT_840779 [Rickenella mellea]|uniref:Uncharacterized protein n=1 Tax=Rickenella mellea TaxID=50990 RepID=A0A4Y7Q1E8_9AGAM|nr:hypothetical protein BD410DRAFT_840779 [Rickenella mellea]
MARPVKYKTDEERLEAARLRRRRWYDKNIAHERLKALWRKQDRRLTRCLVAPNDHQAQSLAMATGCGFVEGTSANRCSKSRAMDFEALAATMRSTLDGLAHTNNIVDACTLAQTILAMWTRAGHHQWGLKIYEEYVRVQLGEGDESRSLEDLDAVIEVGRDFQACIDKLSAQAFDVDPSGHGAVWTELQTLRREAARAVDIAEEMALLYHDGGIASLSDSFHTNSLIFQTC